MAQSDKREILSRIVKTFELLKVDKRLLFRFQRFLATNELEQAHALLQKYNERCEDSKKIKLERPSLHGFEEEHILTRLIQEAYVTARLFNAEERLINALWSDWEFSGENN